MSLAARLVKFRQPLEFVRLPVPSLKRNEVLIKMDFAGVCHTDLHVSRGEWQYQSTLPITLGKTSRPNFIVMIIL